jgi:broad specificity phosphatase PhoE
MMGKPGNRWGDPNFTDDATLIDSPLSKLGIEQAKALAEEGNDAMQSLDGVELVVVSPLTRTLQTMQYAVLPNLPKHVPIVAQPLSTERVYTSSDTGRSVAEILATFKHASEMQTVNFDLLLSSSSETPQENKPWWYHSDNKDQDEWRPNDANQWYGVPGEPQNAFENRMLRFEKWLAERPEESICLVGHWAVLRHMTGGYDFRNCEAKWVEWEDGTSNNYKENDDVAI